MILRVVMKRNKYLVCIFSVFQLLTGTCDAKTLHPIDSTIHALENQTRQDDHYLLVQQQCGSLKQDLYRQSVQLDATKTELANLQKSLNDVSQENKKLKLAQKEHTQTLRFAQKEKKELHKKLASFSQHTKHQKDEIETLKHVYQIAQNTQFNLEQELKLAHQEIDRHLVTVREHEKLQRQLAQARQDLKYPHEKTAHTLQQAALQPNKLVLKNSSL